MSLEINHEERIPNNINLAGDRRLQRALERWHPNFLTWWGEMGPEGWQDREVYLRTAVSVEPGGWAQFDYVRMPDYRWGIFVEPPDPARATIGFGDNFGQPVWQEVPGEHRVALRRMIVTQADTEPGSVEQQRRLGATAPSLHDMRNLFQVNVEEGRHLWAMVYLLHAYFGSDGRDEAEELLARRSGDADKPRILDAFNQPCPNWLDFFAFATFTDRDGKYQLGALAESGFDPLARTCRFMLTEEAHHLSVGEDGIGRIIRRTVELMRAGHDDVATVGGIPLDMVQRCINYWYSYSLDLFGNELSTNGSQWFAAGLKGRWHEYKDHNEHRALDGITRIAKVRDGRLVDEDLPLRSAMNELLRQEYIQDCERVLARWNRILEEAGLPYRLRLPHSRFHRRQGLYAAVYCNPEGELIDAATFAANRDQWLPTTTDTVYVNNLMVGVFEPGKVAGWIAEPRLRIDKKPQNFEFVRM